MRWTIGAVIVWSATASADPPTVSPISADKLPAGVTAHGDKLEWAMTFVDKNGTNYVLVSTHTDSQPATPTYPGSTTNWLYVDPWVVPEGGKPRNLLPVRDFVADCVMGDPSVKFHEASFSVSDLDHDGFAELTFGYQLDDCASDVRPMTYKVLVIENGTKYILRGTTRVPAGNHGETMGGAFTPDPVEAKWPAAFLEHAKDIWAKTSAAL
jgi:hypothetical protein